MRHWEQAKKPRARIEIIPMIDVMMFLLVFFVLISINVIPALGVKTALPTSSQTQDLQTTITATVTLGKDGELQMNGRATTLDQLAADIHALERTRPGARVTVIVHGDKSVDMQRLLDVMDALKEGGFDSMSIAAKKK
jgi:biopolymer transport protein ExbD